MLYYHHKHIFLPTLLIIIGILALLTSLGIFSMAIWKWWPFLLIILGIYIFVWQGRKKRLLKGLMWYGAIHKLMKSEKVEKLLENEKVQKELKKVGDIAEAVLMEQIDKWHKKYTKKEK